MKEGCDENYCVNNGNACYTSCEKGSFRELMATTHITHIHSRISSWQERTIDAMWWMTWLANLVRSGLTGWACVSEEWKGRRSASNQNYYYYLQSIRLIQIDTYCCYYDITVFAHHNLFARRPSNEFRVSAFVVPHTQTQTHTSTANNFH